jgi:predicted RNA-binding Zn-ribbon protein involved in translation (DUF1610 family)
MAPPSSARERSGHRRGEGRPPSLVARIGRVWRGWWAEIVIAVLALLAIFLLVERMEIRQTLFSWLQTGIAWLEALIAGFGQGVVRFVGNTTLSDMLAYLLLVAVVVVLGWRIRYRVLASPRLSETQCPRCGSGLHRIHRRWRHRVLSLFIPVRRYRCTDQACGWQGLRVKTTTDR